VDCSHLSSADDTNLQNRPNLPAWSWEGYRDYYKDFCQLATSFRCGVYSARDYIRKIEEDWNPLGFSSKKPPEHGACEEASKSVCNISDWSAATSQFADEFRSTKFCDQK
jgi:hypothetical protein